MRRRRKEVELVVDALVEEYNTDLIEWLEDNPQEKKEEFLLYEDAQEYAEPQTKNYRKYLLTLPDYRLQKLYDCVLKEAVELSV